MFYYLALLLSGAIPLEPSEAIIYLSRGVVLLSPSRYLNCSVLSTWHVTSGILRPARRFRSRGNHQVSLCPHLLSSLYSRVSWAPSISLPSKWPPQSKPSMPKSGPTRFWTTSVPPVRAIPNACTCSRNRPPAEAIPVIHDADALRSLASKKRATPPENDPGGTLRRTNG